MLARQSSLAALRWLASKFGTFGTQPNEATIRTDQTGTTPSTEAIHAAAIEADFTNRAALIKALTRILKKPHRRAAPLLAATSLVALDVAIEHWQDNNGKRPLATIIEETFSDLQHIDKLNS